MARSPSRPASVIGKNEADRRSPEFSDQMEYHGGQPELEGAALDHRQGIPAAAAAQPECGRASAGGRPQWPGGRRGAVNFAAYTARNFPFALRQPPSDGNALGQGEVHVPEPLQHLSARHARQRRCFDKEVRAFSHGCIRLGDPFDFAYALLARQSDDPEGAVCTNI